MIKEPETAEPNKGLNGWQRIGVALSIVWCVGYGLYFWIDGMNGVNATAGAIYQSCLETHNNWDNCDQTKKYQEPRDDMVTGLEKEWIQTVPVFCAVTLAIGWLAGWGIIRTVRWVGRGFPDRPATKV